MADYDHVSHNMIPTMAELLKGNTEQWLTI